MKRIEFHYTPKHESWLNIAENELSSMTRQCLIDISEALTKCENKRKLGQAPPMKNDVVSIGNLLSMMPVVNLNQSILKIKIDGAVEGKFEKVPEDHWSNNE